jgi:long-chain fatty acid transport protein
MRYVKYASAFIWLTVFLAFPAMVFGHGWAGYEQGAKAHGMGGAFTGLADDPTAIYYNPAGISWLDGTQVSLGFAVPTGRGHYTSDGTSGIPGTGPGDSSNLKKQYFFIPNFYLTSKVNDKISLGFGEYTIFGLGFKWPNSFEGRYAPGGKNGELETMTLSPVVAYQINDRLSVALGGRVERADITLENFIFVAPGVDDVRSKISGDDYGYAWNAGLLFKMTEELSAGLSYRVDSYNVFNRIF